MTKRYYTLAVRRADCDWSPEFGDYDREIVAEELEDFARNYRRKDLRIVTSGDKQADINAAIDALNANWRKG